MNQIPFVFEDVLVTPNVRAGSIEFFSSPAGGTLLRALAALRPVPDGTPFNDGRAAGYELVFSALDQLLTPPAKVTSSPDSVAYPNLDDNSKWPKPTEET